MAACRIMSVQPSGHKGFTLKATLQQPRKEAQSQKNKLRAGVSTATLLLPGFVGVNNALLCLRETRPSQEVCSALCQLGGPDLGMGQNETNRGWQVLVHVCIPFWVPIFDPQPFASLSPAPTPPRADPGSACRATFFQLPGSGAELAIRPQRLVVRGGPGSFHGP